MQSNRLLPLYLLTAVVRCHVVSQFNDGLYDIIIAADETALDDPVDTKDTSNPKQKRSLLVVFLAGLRAIFFIDVLILWMLLLLH